MLSARNALALLALAALCAPRPAAAQGLGLDLGDDAPPAQPAPEPGQKPKAKAKEEAKPEVKQEEAPPAGARPEAAPAAEKPAPAPEEKPAGPATVMPGLDLSAPDATTEPKPAEAPAPEVPQQATDEDLVAARRADERARGSHLNWPAWGGAGLAAVGLAAGIGFGVASRVAAGDAQDAVTVSVAKKSAGAAASRAVIADAAFGVGLAGAGASALFFTVLAPAAPAELSLAPARGGASFALSGSF